MESTYLQPQCLGHLYLHEFKPSEGYMNPQIHGGAGQEVTKQCERIIAVWIPIFPEVKG